LSRNVKRIPQSCCALKSLYKTRKEDIQNGWKTFLWHFCITDENNISSSCCDSYLYKNSNYHGIFLSAMTFSLVKSMAPQTKSSLNNGPLFLGSIFDRDLSVLVTIIGAV
jgi:DNA phosphorothioation-dependent restriction protein DptG